MELKDQISSSIDPPIQWHWVSLRCCCRSERSKQSHESGGLVEDSLSNVTWSLGRRGAAFDSWWGIFLTRHPGRGHPDPAVALSIPSLISLCRSSNQRLPVICSAAVYHWAILWCAGWGCTWCGLEAALKLVSWFISGSYNIFSLCPWLCLGFPEGGSLQGVTFCWYSLLQSEKLNHAFSAPIKIANIFDVVKVISKEVVYPITHLQTLLGGGGHGTEFALNHLSPLVEDELKGCQSKAIHPLKSELLLAHLKITTHLLS